RLQPKPPVDEFLEIMKCETGFQNLSFGAKFCHRWQNQEGYNFIAAGDLTMADEPTGRSEIGRLSHHLQQMQHALQQTVGAVRQG
ncbi:HAMP domain-containing protein, partial [Salmonella enterica subsp. enterica serovar Montevideo]|nr:HAMP domain-containing protein [Salmonella enterica subsp. enterica serovar Montevideo]